MNLPDNNPHSLRLGLFVLNLCFFRKFATYLFSYEQAVELLYGEVASGKQTAEAASFSDAAVLGAWLQDDGV